MRILWIILGIIGVSLAQQAEPTYTEDVEIFKKDKHLARRQQLLGCYLVSRDYRPDNQNENYRIALIKKCMQVISRKDSYNKIVAIIGRNTSLPKKYEQIVGVEEAAKIVESQSEESQFDKMVRQVVRSYEKDIDKILNGKEGDQLRKRVEQQIAKREKYYFGVIPANQLTHLLMLIFISLLTVGLCACRNRYINKKSKDNKEGPKQQKNQPQKQKDV